MSKWECGVCGYIHKGDALPDQCPVCEAQKKMFKEVAEASADAEAPVAASATGGKRWRCLVCGYVHSGSEPPDKCPVCAAPKSQFVEIDADGNKIGEPVAPPATAIPAPPAGGEPVVKAESSFFDKLAGPVQKFHLHPITVHFPNGILPAAVGFLAIALFFNIASLEVAAYYNLIAVLLMLPVVLLTGFIEWQKRYKGIKSFIFVTKILCSLVVLAATSVLVFWRLIDPAVMAQESPSRFIYLGIAVALLGAAGLAGHLGGKLVFGSRE